MNAWVFLFINIFKKFINIVKETCASMSTYCLNGGYPSPKLCSICICPWGFGGKYCEERKGKDLCGKTLQVFKF